MRRPLLQKSSKEEKKPVGAISPDGRWRAHPAPENTVAIQERGVGYWGSYLGHQDGVYHRTNASIQEITWESASLVRSMSSTGSIHLWSVPQCVHVQTLCPTSVRRGRTA